MNQAKQRILGSRHVPAVALLLLLLALHAALGLSPLGPSPYNSYTRQALAWRSGQSHLPADVPHLELAIKDGRYYVSFPPVPSVPIWLLSFLFGSQVPDGLLVKAYALIAFYAFCRLFQRRGYSQAQAGWLSLFVCGASSMLPLMLSGAVWYQAQVMGLMFIALAIDRMDGQRPTWGLLCYALSVGCRPFNALYGPLLMLIYLFFSSGQPAGLAGRLRTLMPGIALGLLAAAAYAWYNTLRFGSPFEFGHNYLPEFSFQGGTQFSTRHIMGNIKGFVFSWPFERAGTSFKLKAFGFSLFLANPLLLWMLLWAASDGLKGRLSLAKWLTLLFFLAQLMLLLMHRTFGGYQFGARYAVDLIPYAAIYLTLDQQKGQRFRLTFVLSMGAALLFCIYGSLMIMLPQ